MDTKGMRRFVLGGRTVLCGYSRRGSVNLGKSPEKEWGGQ